MKCFPLPFALSLFVLSLILLTYILTVRFSTHCSQKLSSDPTSFLREREDDISLPHHSLSPSPPFSCRTTSRYRLTNPLVSLVFTSQGGTFGDGSLKHWQRRATARILKQLWWVSEASARAQLDIEIVLVDWPIQYPSAFRERVLDAIHRERVSLPSNVQQLRILEVPMSLWRKEIPVLEYFGKNIGARRAFGKYLLLGGSDSLPHEKIFEQIKLLENETDLLRCIGAQRQMAIDDDSTGYSYYDYIRWRDTHTWRPTGPYNYTPNVVPDQTIVGTFHWKAAGDFTMCTRKAFYHLRGYNEGSFRTHVDSLLLRHANQCGVSLRIFHPSLSVFHQAHERGKGIIDTHSYNSKEVVCSNSTLDMWGAPNVRMREYVYSYGKGVWYESDCIGE